VAAGAMVIGRAGERREHLLADPERRFAVRHLFPGAREGQARSPQPREWVRHCSRSRRQVRVDAQPPAIDPSVHVGHPFVGRDRLTLKRPPARVSCVSAFVSIPWMVQHARRWRLVKMLRCKGLRGGTGCITHDFSARLA
jgi:hypothetical protein